MKSFLKPLFISVFFLSAIQLNSCSYISSFLSEGGGIKQGRDAVEREKHVSLLLEERIPAIEEMARDGYREQLIHVWSSNKHQPTDTLLLHFWRAVDARNKEGANRYASRLRKLQRQEQRFFRDQIAFYHALKNILETIPEEERDLQTLDSLYWLYQLDQKYVGGQLAIFWEDSIAAWLVSELRNSPRKKGRPMRKGIKMTPEERHHNL
ncbi:MAG: hypothetical protein OXB93_00465 [Cytophagales bacterium]|nr:hypothetical protein [Cytophagales bacterium]